MNIHILSNKVPWFGKYSGYEGLPDYLPPTITSSIYQTKNNMVAKLIGKLYKMLNNLNGRSEDVYNQKVFLNKVDKSSASHILYLENYFSVLKSLKEIDKRLIATIHLPISRWNADSLQLLSKMHNVILLYEEEVTKFSRYISKEKIHIIKHGVDIDFFKPGNSSGVKKNKVLFVGHFLRNFKMFDKVYEKITGKSGNEFEFHFIIPGQHRDVPELQKLAKRSNVFFHQHLSDEELLTHYQDSYVLLMPLNDSGANTAIVQALATGLPIITTDVGGIRSYGGDELFPVVANNDAEAMVALFDQYHNDVDYRNKIAQQQRAYAVEMLDWRKVAEEHVKVYTKVNAL